MTREEKVKIVDEINEEYVKQAKYVMDLYNRGFITWKELGLELVKLYDEQEAKMTEATAQ